LFAPDLFFFFIEDQHVGDAILNLVDEARHFIREHFAHVVAEHEYEHVHVDLLVRNQTRYLVADHVRNVDLFFAGQRLEVLALHHLVQVVHGRHLGGNSYFIVFVGVHFGDLAADLFDVLHVDVLGLEDAHEVGEHFLLGLHAVVLEPV